MISAKRQKKITITETMAEKLSRAKSVVLTDYRGLTMAQLAELRNKLGKSDAEFTVTKNTLLKRALEDQGYEVEQANLQGPSATLFAYGDEVTPIKDLMTFSKTANLPTVKAGYLGRDFLTSNRVEALSKLPSREVLLAQMVGVIQGPISGFFSVLQGNIRSFVYVIQGITDIKQ